jgi:hypothetical protein
LCWDAIVAPIPGAFFHDFQYGPADLEYFYERRRDRFAECFAELESGRYKTIIRRRIIAKAGIQAPFIAWGLLKQPLLECALKCFPAAHLGLWFEWIVRDVVENRTGFPDLVLLWPEERVAVQTATGINMKMDVLCEGSKSACDQLMLEFQASNQRVQDSFQRK